MLVDTMIILTVVISDFSTLSGTRILPLKGMTSTSVIFILEFSLGEYLPSLLAPLLPADPPSLKCEVHVVLRIKQSITR